MTNDYHQRRIEALEALHHIVDSAWSGTFDEISQHLQHVAPELREGVYAVLRDAEQAIRLHGGKETP